MKPFRTGDHAEIATRLIELLGDRARLVYDEGSLYRISGNLWKPLSSGKLSRLITKFSGQRCVHSRGAYPLCINWNDIQGIIKVVCEELSQEGFFKGAPPGLTFDNQFITVGKTGELKKYKRKPEQKARHSFPFPYSTQDPVLFLTILDAVFAGDTTKVKVLREFVGACLLGIATRYQRALVMVGAGGEGKSTVAHILKSVFPEGTVTAISPQLWGNEYRRALLSGKLLNYVAELPTSKILSNDIFKAIVTGDVVDARHIRESPFNYFPLAGHLFGANELPDTHDNSHGFWRRFLILRFDQKVNNFPKELQDVNIATRVIEKEKAQIVGWLIRGACHLVARGKYEEPSSHKDELTQWQLDVDQVAQFLHTFTRTPSSHEKGLSATALYRGYVEWADAQRHHAVSGTRFGIRLRQMGITKLRLNTGIHYPLVWAQVGEEQ